MGTTSPSKQPSMYSPTRGQLRWPHNFLEEFTHVAIRLLSARRFMRSNHLRGGGSVESLRTRLRRPHGSTRDAVRTTAHLLATLWREEASACALQGTSCALAPLRAVEASAGAPPNKALQLTGVKAGSNMASGYTGQIRRRWRASLRTPAAERLGSVRRPTPRRVMGGKRAPLRRKDCSDARAPLKPCVEPPGNCSNRSGERFSTSSWRWTTPAASPTSEVHCPTQPDEP